MISKDSYVKAMEKFNYNPADAIWFSEEEQKPFELEPRFAFLPDFVAMMHADVLFRGNSTFSWWAGILGNGKVYCPVVGNLRGKQDVEFVEGNAEKIFFGGDRMEVPE